jgi:uncharacterized protein (DUF3820 family)
VTDLEFDPTLLLEFARARMPFGRYAGRLLFQLPEPYLVWFRQQGFPAGKLGQQLALALEIRINGLEALVAELAPREG